MKVKKNIEKIVEVCDFCKEKDAVGFCIICSRAVCNTHSVRIQVTPDSKYPLASSLYINLDHDYVYVCPLCKNIKESVVDFLKQFGCSKGNIKHVHIQPV